ncbi:MAG: DUF1512 family protein [Candidatus Freyarchaeum deiterrae]
MDIQTILYIIWLATSFGFCAFCIFQRNMMIYSELRRIRRRVKAVSKMIKETRTMLTSLFDDKLTEEKRFEGYDKVMDYFVIAPIETDPSGVMNRLEYLLDTGDETLEKLVQPLSPDGDLERMENLKQMFKEAIILNRIYKMLRELYISSKKSRSLETVMQSTMNLSTFIRDAKIRFKAVKAYVDPQPIGNGIAPLVASKLIEDSPFEVEDGVVISERKYKDRDLVIIKPKGPGARMRKLGRVAETKIRKEKEIAGVAVVTAQVKLEGEKTAIIVPATGVSFISEPDKFRLEELASERKIPLISIIVKMSEEEYYTKMSDEIRDAAPKVIEKFEDEIEQWGKGKVIVIGSGNTMSIEP